MELHALHMSTQKSLIAPPRPAVPGGDVARPRRPTRDKAHANPANETGRIVLGRAPEDYDDRASPDPYLRSGMTITCTLCPAGAPYGVGCSFRQED